MIATQEPRFGALRVQTSAYGLCIPVIFGTARVSGNLIDYVDFNAVAHTETQSAGGKGGGGGGSTNTTYTYSVTFAMALQGDQSAGVLGYWAGKDVYTDPGSAAADFDVFLGAPGQTPWAYMVGAHPDHADAYPGTTYVARAGYDLGNSDALPNLSFEVAGLALAAGKQDANAADVLLNILTSTARGSLWPSANVGDLTAYATWCRAAGLLISPAYTQQAELQSYITEMLGATNADVVWSGDQLKVIPYADEPVTGDGVTYTPNTTPVYDLTIDDFITGAKDQDAIIVHRKSPADAYNHVQIEYENRANYYNVDTVEAKDQANIETYGLRTKDPEKLALIKQKDTAQQVAWFKMQRALYIRNQYEFHLSWKYSLLEPMDIVTLTHAELGFDKLPVRIVSIDESEDDDLTVIAEDYPFGVATAARYPSQSLSGAALDFNQEAGNVAAPVFFEGPVFNSTTGLNVGVAVAGLDPAWGGCEVWISTDGANFRRMGIQHGNARYGVLTAPITAAAGQVAAVHLAGNGGQMLSGSAVDAAAHATLCVIDNEFVGHALATLTGANAYNLTLPVRGDYLTPPVAHAAGARFVRIDGAIQWSDDLDLSMIGTTLYFKFRSFNAFGGGLQTLDEVVEYAYTVTGAIVKLPPADVANFTYTLDALGVVLQWDNGPDPDRLDYEIRDGAWAADDVIANVAATEYRLPALAAGDTLFSIAARDRFGYSTNPALLTVPARAPLAPAVGAAIAGANLLISGTAPGAMFKIDRYELRYGATFAGGTVVDAVPGNPYGVGSAFLFTVPVKFVGERHFWVAAIDVAGNVGAAGMVSVTITPPQQTDATSKVIDNTALLFWTNTPGTLPIDTWEIRSGATYSTAPVVGTKSGLFTTVSETVGGKYTFWVTGIDTAGNYGVPASLTVNITAPPDYILNADYHSAFGGTKVNAIIADGALLLPVNATETFAQHFTTHGWASPAAQIAAGYPLYIEPGLSSGYHEEIYDYGATLAASKVSVIVDAVPLVGTPTQSIDISTSPDGSTWTAYTGVSEAYATNFRYVKVRVTVSGGGTAILQIKDINYKLDQKIIHDIGTVNVTRTSGAGDIVTFNKPFLSVLNIKPSPMGASSSLTALTNFVGTPNPTQFEVFLFNSVTGARVTGTCGWSADGY